MLLVDLCTLGILLNSVGLAEASGNVQLFNLGDELDPFYYIVVGVS